MLNKDLREIHATSYALLAYVQLFLGCWWYIRISGLWFASNELCWRFCSYLRGFFLRWWNLRWSGSLSHILLLFDPKTPHIAHLNPPGWWYAVEPDVGLERAASAMILFLAKAYNLAIHLHKLITIRSGL